MNRARHFIKLAIAAVLISPSVASATLMFQDNFDTDATSSILNFNAFNNWTVSSGTVDYIRNGGYGIGCRNSSPGCVDLDGSTSNAGRMTTKTTFAFQAGIDYELSLWLSGNQRGGADDSVEVGLVGTGAAGGWGSIAPNDPFTLRVFSFTPTSSFSAAVYIEGLGGDNYGAILDDVTLVSKSPAPVPEPGTVSLLALGILGLTLTRRWWVGRPAR